MTTPSAELKNLLAITAGVFAFSIASHAEVLVNYDGVTDTPTIVAAGISGSPITTGSANTFNEVNSPATPAYPSGPTQSGFGFYRFIPNNTAVLGTDEPSAFANNLYLSLTVTPTNATDRLTVNSLSFNIARGGAATPRGYFVRTSLDNFASDLVGTGPNGDVGTQRPTFLFVNAPISGASNLSSLTLRFYAYTPGTGQSLDIDDIILNGSVVPEPASAALLGLGALSLIARRRRAT